MKASSLSFVAFTALIVAQGCARRSNTGVESPPLLPRGTKDSGSTPKSDRAPTEGFARKTVVGKEEPLRLVARDGTRCTVSEKKFGSAVIGKPIWCNWVEQRQ